MRELAGDGHGSRAGSLGFRNCRPSRRGRERGRARRMRGKLDGLVRGRSRHHRNHRRLNKSAVGSPCNPSPFRKGLFGLKWRVPWSGGGQAAAPAEKLTAMMRGGGKRELAPT